MLSPALRLAVLIVLAGAEDEVLRVTVELPTAVPAVSTLARTERREVWRVSLTLVRLAELRGEGVERVMAKVRARVPNTTNRFI